MKAMFNFIFVLTTAISCVTFGDNFTKAVNISDANPTQKWQRDITLFLNQLFEQLNNTPFVREDNTKETKMERNMLSSNFDSLPLRSKIKTGLVQIKESFRPGVISYHGAEFNLLEIMTVLLPAMINNAPQNATQLNVLLENLLMAFRDRFWDEEAPKLSAACGKDLTLALDDIRNKKKWVGTCEWSLKVLMFRYLFSFIFT